MKQPAHHDVLIHAVLVVFVVLTLTPFVFVVNNSMRTNSEIYHGFFGLPKAAKQAVAFTAYQLTGQRDKIQLAHVADLDAREAGNAPDRQVRYGDAMKTLAGRLTDGYVYAWSLLRPYMLNTFWVALVTVAGVIVLGTTSAYVFSRYRFPGRMLLFNVVLSMMMIPGVLTLVPSFLLVKNLGLLNSYWVLILPYVATGQIFAIFLFKGFFDGLPRDLFESARIDGAGHLRLYWHIVLPLSKPIIAVVAIVNIMGTWNNFLWPFITNTNPRYHVIASGLYLMGQSTHAANLATVFAGYVLSSIPLLVLFIFATRPFMKGITAGAFKA
jgi:ABC-type glycerol-3-phosphate transport system permease component